MAARKLRPISHPGEAPARALGPGRGDAGPVVEDLDPDLARFPHESHERGRLFRVAQRVRQRLLHDPVDGDVEGRRDLLRLALDLERGRQACVPHPLDERIEVGDPRLRRHATVRRIVAEGSKVPAQLGHRLATGGFHREERLLGLVRELWTTCRAAPAWMTMTLTPWAMTSWSSRATWRRSSTAAAPQAAPRARASPAPTPPPAGRFDPTRSHDVADEPRRQEEDEREDQGRDQVGLLGHEPDRHQHGDCHDREERDASGSRPAGRPRTTATITARIWTNGAVESGPRSALRRT